MTPCPQPDILNFGVQPPRNFRRGVLISLSDHDQLSIVSYDLAFDETSTPVEFVHLNPYAI